MKKSIIKLILVSVLFAAVFVSCEKDENADTTNQFVFDGAQYALSEGYLVYLGPENPEPATYGYSILLASSEFSIDFTLLETSGIGEAIIFDFYTSSSTGLTPGTYNFDETYSGEANSFNASVYIDYDFSGGFKSSTYLDVIGGSVTVSKSGTTYEITLDGTVDGGKKITANYKGSLEYHDFSTMEVKSLRIK